ncbi:MAG: hypothetical protein ACR2H4_06930 [Pyrinomonadaceae bacterium]
MRPLVANNQFYKERFYMQRQKKILPLLLAVLAITVLSTLAALPRQDGSTSSKQQSAEEDQLPVADYVAPEPADPEKRAKRRARGKRYDAQNWVMEPHPQSGGGREADRLLDAPSACFPHRI